MVPTNIILTELDGSNNLGAMPTLIRHSMSFQNAIKCGRFPPLEIFNEFAACGYDDIAPELLCTEIEKLNCGVLRWEPFSLTEEEYLRIIEYLRSAFGELTTPELGAKSFGDWFTRCFESKGD